MAGEEGIEPSLEVLDPAARERRDGDHFKYKKNYIILAGVLGLEPRPTVLETVMLPITPYSHQDNIIILIRFSLINQYKKNHIVLIFFLFF